MKSTFNNNDNSVDDIRSQFKRHCQVTGESIGISTNVRRLWNSDCIQPKIVSID